MRFLDNLEHGKMSSPVLSVAIAGLVHDHWVNELPHWSALAKRGLVTVAAVSDPHSHILERVKTTVGWTYDSHEAMLNDASLAIDILAVFSDNASHATIVKSALARKTAPRCVVLEKPLSSTLAGGLEIYNACKEKNVLLLVNWPNWKSLAWRELMKVVREGGIGETRHVEFRAGHAGPMAFGCSPEFVEVLWLCFGDAFYRF